MHFDCIGMHRTWHPIPWFLEADLKRQGGQEDPEARAGTLLQAEEAVGPPCFRVETCAWCPQTCQTRSSAPVTVS
jgi:hypothetical protein